MMAGILQCLKNLFCLIRSDDAVNGKTCLARDISLAFEPPTVSMTIPILP